MEHRVEDQRLSIFLHDNDVDHDTYGKIMFINC